MEVDFENWIFNRLIFNTLNLHIGKNSVNFTIGKGKEIPPDERKPRPFIFSDLTGAKLLNQIQSY